MNKLGIFMNFWEKDWDADHEKYIKKAAKIGFDILEFQAQPLLLMSDDKIRNLKAIADEVGIELTYSLGLDPRYDIASSDSNVRKGGIRYLQDIVKKIKIADGNLLSGVSYAGWGSPDYILNDKSEMLKNSVSSMQEIIKTAEECGVTYCVEAVNRFETAVINTAAEALEYVEMIDSPNIGVLLDTYHMNIEENSIRDAILLVKDKLTSFHTGENNRTPPGKGHINWDEIFETLAEINYQGRIVSEPFVQMGGEVGRDIKVWRNLLPDISEEALDREAKELLEFTRSKILKFARK